MLLDDNPAINDSFHFHDFVRELTGIILSIETTPFTIGIFGPWGSGKTTLMKLTENALGDRCRKIWFNPWKYDNKEAIWNALIQTLLNEMKKDLLSNPQAQTKKLINQIIECGKKLAWYSLKVGANKMTSGLIDDNFLEDLKRTFNNDLDAYDFINDFEDTFSHLVDQYCGEQKLVVFIDDLDRCIPENAITVLESIKLYLDKSRCVFVLGLEKDIVEKGIHFRYKKEINFSGKDYLEKIIQLPFVMPAVKTKDIEQFMNDKRCLPILPSKHKERFIELILAGIDGNIRKLKRFVNCFYLLKKVSNIGDHEWERHETLGKVLLIQMRFPTLYNELIRNHNLLSELTDEIKKGQKPFLNKVCDVTEDEYGIMKFLEKTKDLHHTRKLVGNCLSLTSLTQ